MKRKWEPPTKPSEVDWARLAAFIDGEGSVSIRRHATNKSRPAHHLASIVICQCDPALPIWLKKTFGVGWVSVRLASQRSIGAYNKQPSYVWEVYARSAQWLLEKCLPYFVMKANQAKICLELCATITESKGHGKRVSEELLAKRELLKKQLHELKATPFVLKNIKEAVNG